MPYLNKVAPDPEPIDCRILTAALDLFVDNGYHNVSVHDVQKQANVSIGSIYNHFGGKEGIAKALYAHLLNEIDELMDSILKQDITAKDQCATLIRKLFEYTETHRHIIAFIFNAKHREFLPEEPPICSATPFKKMRDIVQRGIKNGEIRKASTWVATTAVFGGAIRMIQLRLDGVVEEPLTDYTDEIIEAAWTGMADWTSPQEKTA